MARTGRPRAFDPAEALATAQGIFWASGYGGTSIQALVDGVGLERGSLYAAFGDKRRLYFETVKLYWAEYEKTLQAALTQIPLLPALREVVVMPAQLGTVASDPQAPHGCMMGNTIAELVPHDAEATALVTDAFARFADLLIEPLRQAQKRGEVSTASPPEAQAQLLLVLAQGTSLLTRTGTDPATATAAIDAAFAGLRADD
ncbi:TetR/AcrR family transcriptional regulator [Amycolatopsis sp. ATCC 39116]|uniref:TetR/AcrR family transcriptional regulator n=1 Tax=Amycolatopsis sp. (strain ATCC 39116 / 75iv2) TaxID=385957 RepID=UPI0002628C84|nr:TetR/AcrR family transcriptional regulator [Amycolatopsis sp. ATCC 39116]